ncbi:hypothetical protein GCM10022382_11940 [Microbacterium invictum]
MTSRPPRHRLDYVDQLVGDDSAGEAPAGVVREFGTDPSRARDVDVVHLTDVAKAIGTRRTSEHERTRRAKRFVKLLRRQRIALVRTVRAEEVGRAPSRAEVIIDQAAASLVSLTATTSSTGHATVIIAHSHLRDRFLGFPRAESVPGRILITAHDELPAAYEAVVKVFAASDLPEWTLRIAGAVPAELEDSYTRTLADHTGAFSLRDEALSDAARVEEISQAELVVVAAPESNESQSIILLALSLDRAVLVEDTAAMRTLADEVGSEWVRRHPGALTADALETALLALRSSPPADRPNLDAREPNAISAQYTAVFRAAAGEH